MSNGIRTTLRNERVSRIIDQTTDAIAVVAIAGMAISGVAPDIAIYGIVSVALGKKIIAK